MKKQILLLLGMAIVGVTSMSAQVTVPIPDKNTNTQNPSSPKIPSRDYVTMYVYTGEDILTFDFSESIQSLIVTLTDESTGEIQTGSVTRQEPSMPAFLPDYGSFSVTCVADNGSMFYTQFTY